MFLKMNIWDILDEYGIFLVWGAIFICLLIKKSTRKIAIKVLCIIFVFAVAVLASIFICIHIFGNEGIFIGITAMLHIPLLWALFSISKQLKSMVRLNKNGTRIFGTLVRRSLSSRSSSVVAYRINGKEYKCYSHSPLRKYEEGCDKVPVIYDTEDPELSCIEKHDFAPTIALLITYGIFETGMIILTVYLCFSISY